MVKVPIYPQKVLVQGTQWSLAEPRETLGRKEDKPGERRSGSVLLRCCAPRGASTSAAKGSWQGAGDPSWHPSACVLWAAGQKEDAVGDGNALRGPLPAPSQGMCQLKGWCPHKPLLC